MTSRTLATVILLALALCAATLARQHFVMQALAQRHDELAVGLAGELGGLREHLEAQQVLTEQLHAEIRSLRAQLSEAAGDAGDPRFAGQIRADNGSPAAPMPLEPGIYVLDPASDAGAAEDRYTIYHLVATVAVDDFEQGVQFGAARAGLVTWQFYFDYDGDGRVDTDMLREFVDSVPFGGYLSGSFDPDESQRLYDRFTRSSGDASFTPLERIPEESGTIARQLWAFLVGSSEEMAAWIRRALAV